MAGRADLGLAAGVAALAAPAVIDQAVFTSIRSPLARGYRIVAASSGVSEDEKREIVQRAPSHGNLIDETDQATAVAMFVLRSGRHCLMFARHAGPEPSGRGGLRVHTHVFLLTPTEFRRLGCNPFRVERCLRAHIDASRHDPALSSLPRIAEPDPAASERDRVASSLRASPGSSSDSVLAVEGLLSAVLSGCRTLVTHAIDPRPAVEALLDGLPLAARRELSFVYGMKPSPQRAFQLLLLPGEFPGSESFAVDQGYALRGWAAPVSADEPYAVWLAFVRRTLEGGGARLLRRGTDDYTGECAPAHLERLAAALEPPTLSAPVVAPTDDGRIATARQSGQTAPPPGMPAERRATSTAKTAPDAAPPALPARPAGPGLTSPQDSGASPPAIPMSRPPRTERPPRPGSQPRQPATE